MKHKRYHKITRKLALQMLYMMLIAGGLLLLLRLVFSNKFGNWIVSFLNRTFSMEYEYGLYFYRNIIRDNTTILVIIAFSILLVFLFRFSLSWFTKYFTEIEDGLDKLLDEKGETIKLSMELDFMEDTLNSVKEVLEKREFEAKEAKQRKDDLVVYLAHDIKTPLTTVIGYLNLIAETSDLPPEQRAKYIGLTLEKAYRLEDLVNEFFDITRFNLHSLVLHRSRIDISLMLDQLQDQFYPLLVAENKTLEVDAPIDLYIHVDGDKLARVFNNIIKNAISYSDENTEIHILATETADHVTIECSNRGETISKEAVDMIFDKFYRLDASRSSETGGSGLGLAIAKEIILAHKGEISLTSEDGITCFKILLPK